MADHDRPDQTNIGRILQYEKAASASLLKILGNNDEVLKLLNSLLSEGCCKEILAALKGIADQLTALQKTADAILVALTVEPPPPPPEIVGVVPVPSPAQPNP